MLTDTETPRAWVGCLGCYNAGVLNGAWVDGEQAGDISLAVKVIERESYLSVGKVTVCVVCGSDEFWVFDHENFDGLISGECSPMEAQEKAELLSSVDESERDAWRAWLANGMVEDLDTMRDAYVGEYESDQAMAEEYVESTGLLSDIPESIARYFDMEAFARDLMYDHFESNGHYFRNF